MLRTLLNISDGVKPGSGNFEYYGIEVCESMSASDKDFLANEQAALEEAARLLKKWGLPANRNTVRLHNEFSYTACPHRSMKIRTGIDPLKQSITESARLKLKDYFIKQIRAFMKGENPKPKTSKNKKGSASTPATRKDLNGFKTNRYGTLYKSKKGKFTANTAIITRKIGPFTTCPQSGVLYPGKTIYYDTVCKQDGHVWLSYTTSKGYDVWLPIQEWDKNSDKTGKLWGILK